MSTAWETSFEDLQAVLEAHEITASHEALIRLSKSINDAAVAKAALNGNTMGEQTAYAYEEIERQLTSQGVIPLTTPRHWKVKNQNVNEPSPFEQLRAIVRANGVDAWDLGYQNQLSPGAIDEAINRYMAKFGFERAKEILQTLRKRRRL